jgi:hypothetical protein
MGTYAPIARTLSGFNRAKGLGNRADLVELYQDCIADGLAYTAGNYLRVGYEDIVSNELNRIEQRFRCLFPSIPVILGPAVLKGHNRVLLEPAFEQQD